MLKALDHFWSFKTGGSTITPCCVQNNEVILIISDNQNMISHAFSETLSCLGQCVQLQLL